MVSFTSRAVDSVSTGGTPQPIWTFWKEKSLAHDRNTSPRMSSLRPIPHTDSVKLLMAQHDNDGGKTTFRVAADSRPSGSVCPCVEDVTDSWLSQGSELDVCHHFLLYRHRQLLYCFVRLYCLSVCRYCIPLLLSLLYNSVTLSAVINPNHILWNNKEQDLCRVHSPTNALLLI